KGGLHEPETDSTDRVPVATDQASAAGNRPDASGLAHPPVQRSPTPRRGLLADQLHPSLKSRTEYVRKEWVKELRRQIATHKRFKRLIDLWLDLSIEPSQLTMQTTKTKSG